MARLLAVLFCAGLLGLAHGKALLEPSSGSYFGVSVDFQTTNVQSYLTRTGVQPVVWNVFVSLPMNSSFTNYLQTILPQIAAIRGIVLLTVEPDQGLAAVTSDSVVQLASYIVQYEKAGASFMVRYGHEMNGNWYPWGQQPVEYVASHKFVTAILRNNTCGVAMVWAPNSAEGYPWSGGHSQGVADAPALKNGSANFKALDTNGNGNVDGADDPYLPYYPGDDYVDWVGMSSFQFGGAFYPYTSNQEASPMKFTSAFTGSGTNDFYGRFCNDSTHQKPMVITETSSMYNPANTTGETDFQIKSVWWQQVFNVQGDTKLAKDMAVSYPKVKAILWFDEIKTEVSAGGLIIDWRYSANQKILSGLSSYIQVPAKSTGKTYWLQLGDFASNGDAFSCANVAAAASAPNVRLPTSTVVTSTYSAVAPTANNNSVSVTPATPSKTTTTANTTSAIANTNIANLIGRRRLT